MTEIGGICISKNIHCAYAKQDGYCALTHAKHEGYCAMGGKQSNYEKIMAEMTIEEMAELRTTGREYEQYGEMNYEYENDAGTWLFFDDAIAGEIEWLKENV